MKWILVAWVVAWSVYARAASSSASYSIDHDTLDSGGRTVVSGLYTFETSISTIGGVSLAAAPPVSLRARFAGQLNDPPLASAESFSTARNTALNIAAPGVLLNDTDFDKDPLTASVVTTPAHGTLILAANGSFSYTPESGFAGTDQFTYRASDGINASAPATVTLRVDAVNRPPTALADGFTLAEDATLATPAPGLLANDSDPDSDSLAASLVGGPAHGAVTLNADGSFFYVPAANYNGPDAFTYRITDGQVFSGTATVSLTINPVNDPPLAGADTYATARDAALNLPAPGVLGNDSDIEGAPLTAVLVTGPARGSLSLSPSGAFIYTPGAGFSGSDSFVYKATDGVGESAPTTVSITVAAVNRAPVAVANSYTTLEDQPLTVAAPGVLGNDSDPDGDPVSAILVTGPARGTLTLGVNGSFLYTPSANLNGSDSFSYRASDGILSSSPVVVRIDITAVDDPPTATPATVAVAEDTALPIVLAGSDPEGAALSFFVVTPPAHGSLTGTPPTLTYTPSANFNGPDSFTFKCSDGSNESVAATVSITVTPVNDSPTAANNSYSTAANTPLTVAAPGVLGNDSDLEGSPLTAVLVSGPGHGTLSLSSSGGFTYTPASGYSGPDSFSYKANDGTADSSAAIVNLSVGLANRAPSSAGDSYTTLEDTVLDVAAPGVLGNDLDPDGDSLTIVLTAPPAHGTLVLDPLGSFRYTPSAHFFGADGFSYKISDGSLESAVAAVSIVVNAVNDAPTANAQTVTLNEDTTASITLTGSDPESSPLTFIVVTPPAKGSLTGTAPALTYTPAANFNGTDNFTFKVSDGALESSLATVSITVSPINDPPVIAGDSYSTAANTILVVAAPGVLANDTDVEGNTLTATLVTGTATGALTLNANGSFSYNPASGFSGTESFTYKVSDGFAETTPATVTLKIGLANRPPSAAADSLVANEDQVLTLAAPGILANDSDPDADTITAILVTPPSHGTLVLDGSGSLRYTPSSNYSGPDSFLYKVTDGTLESAPAIVNLSVLAINDPPITAPDSYNIVRDTVLTAPAPGVLLNDSDVEGSPITASLVTGPAHGSVSLAFNGSFTYTPAAGFSGTDSFVYLANDGSADSSPTTVTINIGAVNRPPVAVVNNYAGTEDLVLTIAAPGVLSNDSDPEGSPITAVLVSGPSHGTLSFSPSGGFVYTPVADFTGADSFTYQANDGSLSSDVTIVRIDLAPVNDRPTANAASVSVLEDGSAAIVLTGSDPEGDALNFVLVSGPAHGSLTGTAPFLTYTPSPDYNGPDSFTFKVNDVALESTAATVSIMVTAVNDPPLARADAYSTGRDSALNVPAPGVLGNDSDPEGGPLTAAIVSGPGHGTISLAANGSFLYTPASGYAGPDSFSYKAHDGSVDSAAAVVSLTVTTANRAPVGTIDRFVALEDQTLTVPIPGVLGNDTDPDGDPVVVILVSGPAQGTLSLDAAGSFRYVPKPNFSGTDGFTYRVSDGSLQSGNIAVTLTVVQVNDPPIAIPQAITLPEDSSIAITLSGADIDGNTLQFEVITPPANGVLTGTSPVITYSPKPNFFGTDAFTFKAFDGSADSAPVSVTLQILPVNDPPTALAQNLTVAEGATLPVVLAGTDPDGDTLSFVITRPPTRGTLSGTPPSLRYTPPALFSGEDSFEFKASDGSVQSAAARVTINVNSVNTPPVIDPIASQTTPEDTQLEVRVKVSDREFSPTQLALTARSLTPALFADAGLVLEGTGDVRLLRITPVKDQAGLGRIELTLRDPSDASTKLEFSVEVTPVNDPPVALKTRVTVLEDKSVSINLEATDVDSPRLTFTSEKPAHGSLKGEGSRLTYTPEPNFSGSDRFTFRASDGASTSEPAEVEIVVFGAADPPFIAPTKAQRTDEDVPLSVRFQIEDPDGLEGLRFVLDSSDRLLLPLSGMELLGSGAERTLVMTPAPEQSGNTKVSIQVIDPDSLQHTVEFELVVHEVNDAPLISPISEQTVLEDSELTVEGIIILDAESPPNALKVEPQSDNPGLVDPREIKIENEGIFYRLKLRPNPNRNGTAKITLLVKDPKGEVTRGGFDLQVIPVNDAPTALNRKITTGQGIEAVFSLKGTDPDDDPLQFVVLTPPSRGRLLGTPPKLTYVPEAGFSGEDRMTFLVSDGVLRSAPATVTISVLDRQRLRRFSSIIKPVQSDSPVVLQFVSIAGKRYILEYSDNLSSGVWTIIRSVLAEDGGELTLNDDTPSLPKLRFYRVREE